MSSKSKTIFIALGLTLITTTAVALSAVAISESVLTSKRPKPKPQSTTMVFQYLKLSPKINGVRYDFEKIDHNLKLDYKQSIKIWDEIEKQPIAQFVEYVNKTPTAKNPLTEYLDKEKQVAIENYFNDQEALVFYAKKIVNLDPTNSIFLEPSLLSFIKKFTSNQNYKQVSVADFEQQLINEVYTPYIGQQIINRTKKQLN